MFKRRVITIGFILCRDYVMSNGMRKAHKYNFVKLYLICISQDPNRKTWNQSRYLHFMDLSLIIGNTGD